MESEDFLQGELPMDIISYVVNENDAQQSEQILRASTTFPVDSVQRVVNLVGTEPTDVPSEVIQVMMLKKTNTFPLLIIDGKPVVSGRQPTEEELRLFITEGVQDPAVLVNRADSAVDFPTKSRIHISMDVGNIEESIRFYRVFFGQEPTKVRDNYAKFEVEEPPLNIALNHFQTPDKGGPIAHLGVQVKSSDAVLEAKERFTKAGFYVEEELATACCYAVQTKVWVADPDGNRWEVFVVTESNAQEGCGPDCACFHDLQPSHANA
jgi:catechol 2,3-dioxygenase-like lactoylglutathione lyase family enzyme